MGVYSHWVYTAKCIVGVYSDWVYNAKCIVGTAHMLKTKPVVLWVNNWSYIVGVSGNHDNSDTRVGLRKIGASFLHDRIQNCLQDGCSATAIRDCVFTYVLCC